MNLIADIGNTSTKVAIFDSRHKILIRRMSEIDYPEIDKLTMSENVSRAIVSSVKEIPEFLDFLSKKIKFVQLLTYRTKLPFSIDYETPETLGSDRIAAVAAAHALYPGKSVLVIDAGTAITYDLLSDNTFKGGNISPGISMRFRALHEFTDKLPLITATGNYSFPGRNTTDAIAAGVVSGVIYEINEYIRTFEEKDPGIKILISGGDGGMLRDKLQYHAEYVPDIVIDGLNYILEYNAK
ncbi:MAG TPA: type III pantothenate kinase [Bacteroidales bacterium]|nr:type III pantothenate kinase [Bacteroidales bacterium]